MKVVDTTIEIAGIRCAVSVPTGGTRWPAVLAYPDIFQLTPAHLRMVRRLASYGFVVVAPELYRGIVAAGVAFDFQHDRALALDASARVELVDIDRDVAAVIDAVTARDDVNSADVYAVGWCFGGHLAWRAALLGSLRAVACCYPTGVHNGTLGASLNVDTLGRARDLNGELLLVWGRDDPHIPAHGRSAIHRALDDAAVRYEARLFDAEHAFMRDHGARFDAEASDRAFEALVALFKRNRSGPGRSSIVSQG